jgi:hypothetical protein
MTSRSPVRPQAAASVAAVESRIQTLRGQRVLLDADLAELYGVDTKRLNEQVKRNLLRFPLDFMFQLTTDEKEEVWSQIATTSPSSSFQRVCLLPSPSTARFKRPMCCRHPRRCRWASMWFVPSCRCASCLPLTKCSPNASTPRRLGVKDRGAVAVPRQLEPKHPRPTAAGDRHAAPVDDAARAAQAPDWVHGRCERGAAMTSSLGLAIFLFRFFDFKE